jgi:hypothetical protein
MFTFAFLTIFAVTPDLSAIDDDFDVQDMQNHAEAANRLALGEVLAPSLSWPVPDWAFAEMPWISVTGLPHTGQLVAAVVAAAIEEAMEAEDAQIDAQIRAHEAWQRAIDWVRTSEMVKPPAKPSPFDAKLSPFTR